MVGGRTKEFVGVTPKKDQGEGARSNLSKIKDREGILFDLNRMFWFYFTQCKISHPVKYCISKYWRTQLFADFRYRRLRIPQTQLGISKIILNATNTEIGRSNLVIYTKSVKFFLDFNTNFFQDILQKFASCGRFLGCA
jgi:hypothetical protein